MKAELLKFLLFTSPFIPEKFHMPWVHGSIKQGYKKFTDNKQLKLV